MLVAVRVAEALDRTGFAPEKTVKDRPDAIFGSKNFGTTISTG
jgi:hypothetical protein